MQEGIGDKVVIAEGEQPPPGFPREGRRTAFGGWNTFYRDAPSLRS
jgi:hypothetical protein